MALYGPGADLPRPHLKELRNCIVDLESASDRVLRGIWHADRLGGEVRQALTSLCLALEALSTTLELLLHLECEDPVSAFTLATATSEAVVTARYAIEQLGEELDGNRGERGSLIRENSAAA